MLASSSEAPLKPICVQCSAAWSKEHTDGLPGSVPAERALITRPTPSRYIAIAKCRHGKPDADEQTDIVELGAETPSDNKVRAARAFA